MDFPLWGGGQNNAPHNSNHTHKMISQTVTAGDIISHCVCERLTIKVNAELCLLFKHIDRSRKGLGPRVLLGHSEVTWICIYNNIQCLWQKSHFFLSIYLISNTDYDWYLQ